MSTYTWKITDPSLVRSMKNAKNRFSWKSPRFSINGFSWYLKVYPNGHRDDDKGHVQLFLGLAFLPPKVKSLRIGKEFRLIETDTIYNRDSTYHKDNMSVGWPFKTLKAGEIQNVTTLTFSAEIDAYCVIDLEDNDVTNQYINTNDEESKHSALQSVKQSDQKLI
eukprot:179804_1